MPRCSIWTIEHINKLSLSTLYIMIINNNLKACPLSSLAESLLRKDNSPITWCTYCWTWNLLASKTYIFESDRAEWNTVKNLSLYLLLSLILKPVSLPDQGSHPSPLFLYPFYIPFPHLEWMRISTLQMMQMHIKTP